MIERITEEQVQKCRPLYKQLNDSTPHADDTELLHSFLMLVVAHAAWIGAKQRVSKDKKLEILNILISDLNEFFQEVETDKLLETLKTLRKR